MVLIERLFSIGLIILLFFPSSVFGTTITKRIDLQITGVNPDKTETCQGCSVNIKFSVRIIGTYNKGFNVDIYFARGVTQSYLKPANRLLRIPIKRIPIAGRNLVLNKKVVIPAGTRNGNYFFTIVADPDKKVTESNENNNNKSGQIKIVSQTSTIMAPAIPRADLEIRDLNLSETEVYPGESIRVQFAIRNIGDTNSSRNTFKIAVKATGMPKSPILVTLLEDNAGSIRKGGMAIVDRKVTIPGDMTPSIGRTIWVMADSTRRVPEKNERNNTVQTPINIKKPPCDLQITAVSVEERGIHEGDRIHVKFTERNEYVNHIGAATSEAGRHHIKILFRFESSSGRIIGRVLKHFPVDPLAGEDQREFNELVILPSPVPQGYHHIEVTTDSRGLITEHNEENNQGTYRIWIN